MRKQTDWAAIWDYCADLIRNNSPRKHRSHYAIDNAALGWMVWKENQNRIEKVGWAATRKPFLRPGMDQHSVIRQMARRARAEFGPWPRPFLGANAPKAADRGIEAVKFQIRRHRWSWRLAKGRPNDR